MNLLGAILYDPAGSVTKACTSNIAMTAFDTTNLRLTVTVPAHGMIRVKMSCAIEGAATFPQILLGMLVGSTVTGRISPQITINGTALSTTRAVAVAEFTVTGLTPGSTVFDAAYGVEFLVASSNIRYGGPNNTTASDAWGGFQFEIWDPRPLTLALDGGVNVAQWKSNTVPATNVNGVPIVDDKYLLGTIYSTPATAGIQDVNAKNWNNLPTVELPLVPTTAGRKLDVSAGGEAGLDWANIGSPTTVQGLSGTTVKTATDVETDTQDIQARLPAALGANGNIKADVRDFSGAAGTFASGRPEVNTTHFAGTAATAAAGIPEVKVNNIAANAITAASIAADAIGASELAADAVTEIQSGLATAANLATVAGYIDTEVAAIKAVTDLLPNAGALTSIQADLDDIQSRLPVALGANGNIKADVRDFGGTAATSTGGRPEVKVNSIAIDAVDAAALKTDAVTEIQTGLATSSALATVDARLDTEIPAILEAVDTEVAAILADTNAIKAKTDQLTFTTANQVDANALAVPATADDAILAAVAALNNLSAADIRAAVGLVSANLDTQLDAIPTNADLATALAGADDANLAAIASLASTLATIVGYIDTEVAAIKAKTDQLTFSVVGEVDANTHSINDVTVTGTGETGTEWGPA